jgi:hypothetical protein
VKQKKRTLLSQTSNVCFPSRAFFIHSFRPGIKSDKRLWQFHATGFYHEFNCVLAVSKLATALRGAVEWRGFAETCHVNQEISMSMTFNPPWLCRIYSTRQSRGGVLKRLTQALFNE